VTVAGGVELELGELLGVLLVVLEPDEDVVFLPELCWPPSGSMYCWSPADGPDASAAAGTANARTASTTSAAIMTRQKRTSRVCQAVGIVAAGAPLPDLARGAQILVLQDLLHDQGNEARLRRLVLGCSPPRCPEAIWLRRELLSDVPRRRALCPLQALTSGPCACSPRLWP